MAAKKSRGGAMKSFANPSRAGRGKPVSGAARSASVHVPVATVKKARATKGY